jgi:hypothetical protein
MSPKPAQRQASMRLAETGSAFLFGCAALGGVLWLAFRGEGLSDQQFAVLRIALALAGGGVAAVIPGFLDLSMKASAKLALRAGGALTVFVVLYFWSPAHWQRSRSEANTEGLCSPIQSGNGNTANCNGVEP